uniref:Putative phage metallopeptidase domain-containing protein n=1 Tax=viral metagenome TaxID=1070528 RepID=A0A6M3IZK0_9ZZZZ
MSDIEIRFEEAPEQAYKLLKKIMKKYFTDMANANILILMDTKIRTADSGNKIILGRFVKTNDLTRHLTIDESGTDRGFDYIMFLDKVMWDNIDDADRERIIRHELRHALVADKFQVQGHSIEDFYEEVELNQDDPRWRERVALVTQTKYDALKNPQQKLPL